MTRVPVNLKDSGTGFAQMPVPIAAAGSRQGTLL
jgi:hypothetical protein